MLRLSSRDLSQVTRKYEMLQLTETFQYLVPKVDALNIHCGVKIFYHDFLNYLRKTVYHILAGNSSSMLE